MRTRPALTSTLAALLLLPAIAAAQAETPAPPPAAPAQPAEPAPQPPAQPVTTPLAHVESRGTGPVTLILIPGLVSDWTTFDTFMTRNADRYTMHAVTLPGFGGSEPPPTPAAGDLYTLGSWLGNAERAVRQLIEEKKIEKPVLVGQALGGHVALRLIAREPAKYHSAIVFNSMPAYPVMGPNQPVISKAQRAQFVNEFVASQIKTIDEAAWQVQQAQWITDSVRDPERAKVLVERAKVVPQAVSSRYMLEYLGADVSPELENSGAKVLVVAAVPEAATEPDTAKLVEGMWRTLYEKIPGATVVFFEGSHEFMTEDDPAELDRAIDQFLTGKPVEGKAAPKPAPEAPKPDAPKPEAAPEPKPAGDPAPPPALTGTEPK